MAALRARPCKLIFFLSFLLGLGTCKVAMAGRKKVYGFAEVARHSDREDCWFIVSGKVYDVTPYMEEHPGGDVVLLAVAGRDASNDFDDIGHSNDAKETMNRYYIGDVDPSTLPAKRAAGAAAAQRARRKPGAAAGALWLTVLQVAAPVLLLLLAFAIQRLSIGKKDF